MASWDEILNEICCCERKDAVDYVRKKYLSDLSRYTKRNTIIYYSSWLTNDVRGTDINDNDINGFMNAMKGLDCSKGLDLILHTPGGYPTAAEAIVKYLRNKFGKDIRVIIPQLAMSAGTMIACAGREIIMGKQSSLGPIDPQFNGIPAFNIVAEFNEAKKDLSSSDGSYDYWKILLSKYPAAFVKQANDAIELSDVLLRDWLRTGMLSEENDECKVDKICEYLNEHEKSKVHSRHFDIKYCISIGLNVAALEDDQKLQDLVLSVHHSCMHSFSNSNAVKIIENRNGKAFICLFKGQT